MKKTPETRIGQTHDKQSAMTPRAFLSAIGQKGQLHLRNLFGQSASAIGDQGFFALGNFAVNTILARQMSQAAFGRFSAAFAAFLLLSTVYCAFVVDPMLIYGVSTASGLQKSYVHRVVALHWRAALALSGLLLGFGLIRWRLDIGQGTFLAYLGWAIAAPAVLRLWLARRTAYLVMKPHYAAIAGCVYLVVVAALLLVFGNFLSSNVVAACLLVGIVSVAVAIFLHRSLPLADADPASRKAVNVVGAHWNFGKWAGIAGILSLFPDYVYFFVLSPEKCGQYRALLNVVLPLIQVYNAMSVLMMSYFARHRDQPDFHRIVWRMAAGFVAIALLLAVLAASFGGAVFGALYGGKYDLRFGLLWPLCVVSVLFALRMVSDALLRSIENVTTLATVAVMGAIAAVAIGVPLAMKFGILGAVYGDLLVYIVSTITIAVVWFRLFKHTRAKPASVEAGVASGSAHLPQLTASETPLQSFIES